MNKKAYNSDFDRLKGALFIFKGKLQVYKCAIK
jgi:hypothetical protein